MTDHPPSAAKGQDGDLLAIVLHLLPLTWFFGIVVGIVAIIAPIMVLSMKDTHVFTRQQARSVLDLQISVMIYFAIALVLLFATFGLAMVILIPMLFLGMIFLLILPIIGAIYAATGKHYDYPLTLRVVRNT